MMKIGIIGLGFVGNAIKSSYDFNPSINLVLIDQDLSKGYHGTYQDLKECSGVFVCVSSPQKLDGSCDTSPLESVLENLIDYDGVIISKVTAPPDVYERLNKKYKNLVHSPEFLTAANSVIDYQKSSFVIIGGDVTAYRNEAERIILKSLGKIEVKHCTIKEAAFTKYVINSFLATKVIFMNEMYELCEKSNINYNSISNMVSLDSRIGKSHLQVPGPDHFFGFGGACFPKDTNALLKYAESLNINLNILESAVKKNTFLRLTEPK